MKTIKSICFQNPLLTSITLFSIALVFRIIDIFILKFDERIGELILSKSLGIILVVLFLISISKSISDIGLHRSRASLFLLWGFVFTSIALVFSYGIDYLIELLSNHKPVVEIWARDSKAGVTGGILFALFLLAGNLINAFMEEGLFRGTMIPLLMNRMSRSKANLVQAILFGVWHLVWTIKVWSELINPGAVSFSIISNFLPQFIMGLIWGYMYIRSNSLWSSWISHVIINSCFNFFHIRSAIGLDSGMAYRVIILIIVMSLTLIVFKRLSHKKKLSQLHFW